MDRTVVNWLQRCTARALHCMLFVACAPANAQWQTYPTPERTISAVIPYRTAAGTTYFTIGFTSPSKRYLYRSTDGGRSWSGTLTDPILRIFTVPMATDPPGLDGALYAVVHTGGDWLSNLRCEIRRSTDAGLTWTEYAPESQACSVAIDPTAPPVIFGAGMGEVPSFRSRSLDGGKTWQDLSKQIPYWSPQFKIGADGAVYALNGNPFVSRDRGATFTELKVREQTGGGTYDILPMKHPLYDRGFLLAATTTGLHKSIDGGITWTPAGFQGFQVGNLAAIDQPAGAPPKVGVGFRGGFAIWTEDSIVSMTNGLSTADGTAMAAGIGIAHSGGPGTLSFCADLQSCIGGNLPATGTLVEFRNSNLDHYFITLEGAEARAIDAGAAGPGWSRTGHTFNVYADIQATPYSVSPACRFHGTPGIGPNSHFYSIYAGECDLTQHDMGWAVESSDAFGAVRLGQVSDASTGKFVFGCPYSRTVYRLYNNRAATNDSNHRYVNDLDVYKAMQAKGWVGEGPAFCERPIDP